MRDLAGEYRSTRSIYNHADRYIHFPGNGHLRVSINLDNTLSIDGQAFYEQEPLVYSLEDGTSALVFHQNGNGKVEMLFNDLPLFAYERISWYETSTFNLTASGICYVLLLSAVLAAFIGRLRRSKGIKTDRLPRIARIWALIISVVFLLVPVTMIIYTQFDFKFGFPLYMVIVLAIILAASILVIGPVIFTVFAWVRRYWGVAGRLHYTLITVALLGMVWLMYYWRILGFRY